jgi:hypothetical protein
MQAFVGKPHNARWAETLGLSDLLAFSAVAMLVGLAQSRPNRGGAFRQSPRTPPAWSREGAWFGACIGRCTEWQARHSREWRVLAGFWREKAGAGRVPSFISACATANARRGIFRALSPWREGALGAPP